MEIIMILGFILLWVVLAVAAFRGAKIVIKVINRIFDKLDEKF